MKIRGRIISRGIAEGEAIVSHRKFSFLGDVDVETGVVVAEDSDIEGESIAGKVFVFPAGRGSTVGTYVLLRMKKKGTAPKAIINVETEPIIAVGAIIAEIPLIDKLEVDPLETIESGDYVKVNAVEGWVEVYGR
jgi:predicted aconitase with swiveling domain